MKCGRCSKPVAEEWREYCWWCMGPMCGDCWDDYGMRYHPDADTYVATTRVTVKL